MSREIPQRGRPTGRADRTARQLQPPWWLREARGHRRVRNGRDPAQIVDELVDAAMRIADAEGFTALSMRRMAAELDMGTMSLYSYVDGKDDILDLIFDRAMQEILLEPHEQADWRTGLTAIAHRFRRMGQAHPWVVRLFGVHASFTPTVVHHVDQSLGLFAGVDIDRRTAMSILGTVDDYVIGRLQREQSVSEMFQRTGMTEAEWIESFLPYIRNEAEKHDLEHVLQLIVDDDLPEPGDEDVEFEDGLELILAGAAAVIAAATSADRA